MPSPPKRTLSPLETSNKKPRHYQFPSEYTPQSDPDHWSPIIRPSSTPYLSVPLKYDDSLRHSSFSSAMYAPSTRISGRSYQKDDWSFPDFVVPSNTPPYPSPSSSTTLPSLDPPRTQRTSAPPTRKRGKLPKETTDFLKAWLHRHSDHPYPSEDEKKQLCHATGLSMSQVSNWMINARRRILAPAHRNPSGPTTTTPFPPSIRGTQSTLLDPSARRASMPTDSLQLYHPLSLQSLSSAQPPPEYYGSTRHLLGLPPASDISRQYTHPSGNALGLSSSNRLSLSYQHSPYLSSSAVPLSAPPVMPSMSFSHGQPLYTPSNHHQQQQHQQASSPSSAFLPSPQLGSTSPSAQTGPGSTGDHAVQQSYYTDPQSHPSSQSHSASTSTTGSGYPTPQ